MNMVYLWNCKQFNIAKFCYFYIREQYPILNNLKYFFKPDETMKPINI